VILSEARAWLENPVDDPMAGEVEPAREDDPEQKDHFHLDLDCGDGSTGRGEA